MDIYIKAMENNVTVSIHNGTYHLFMFDSTKEIASMDIACSLEKVRRGEEMVMEDVLYVLSLYVSPPHQGKGIGTSLLKYGLSIMVIEYPHVRMSLVDDMSESSVYDKIGYVLVSPDGPEKQLELLFQ